MKNLITLLVASASIAGGQIITPAPSTSGGAGKVLQMDASGNLTLGPTYTGSSQLAPNGNLFMPDLHGIRWNKQDGSASGYRIFPWEQHDGQGGEFLIESPWRIAIAGKGPVQMGVNDSARNAYCLYLVSGGATVGDPLRASKAILQSAQAYNGGSQVELAWGMQTVPTSNSVSVMRFNYNASVSEFAGGYSSTTGDLTGTNAVEFAAEGVWSLGTAPAFVALANDGTNVTQTCSKYRTTQTGSVSITGNRNIVITGAVNGSRGSILVTRDTSARTLALPAGSLTPASWASGFALLSTTTGLKDRLQWEFDGSNYYWSATNDLAATLDADTGVFIAAGRANITNTAQKTAVDTLVTGLKNSNVSGTGTLWSKLLAIYPFVGGNATAHAKNLKSTSYDITWSGTVTHDSAGITGNGSTGYGNTNFPMSAMAQNSAFIYTRCKTVTPTNATILLGMTLGSRTKFQINTGGGQITAALNSAGDGSGAAIGGTWAHHFAINRSASTGYDIVQDSTATAITATSITFTSDPVYLLAENYSNVAYSHTNATLGFVAFGASLTTAEQSAFRVLEADYETALGR